ncbi:aminomethyl-transferring glycine dehydrogenase [Mycolicibacterium wolinskyi]|uniref:Glycine dehydrogenase (decarboxylating) n=1 Tax=Mycolicibacterium wolinskyi TaxID=59750 RepID=A0A1X2ES56_9MYCO|nr:MULTISPECIES: aminomethyl-transferring glycine dehydrogenase [Mycolicibacterium]MCV7290405.1 aminomethyl-transferring glycine dehydrogenase [Mycolicibacterium wolinskyi]MCV7297778.1 aminomethyl-transferring glycine dehydrogenase [Mycolicibacterium goodii]ORX09005.1 glycine dehydrogenase (aminomethyl-transferring) [Mycolicibacterium wolinskyi]
MNFPARHIGPDADETAHMLRRLGYRDLDQLIDAAVPDQIRITEPLDLPAARDEDRVLSDLRTLADRNRPRVQMIGLGYYDTVTPAVLRRNMLESPAWYTAYTPYQPEISQGRLEALLTFQTMIQDLTALPIAGASLLDEATAVMEAVLLMRRANKSKSSRVILDAECLPQTIALVRGRARAVGIDVEVAELSDGLPDGDAFGVVLQAPGASGVVRGLAELIADAAARGMLTTVAADLLSLTLLRAPGELGADIAVGSAQRFGVPLFFGGPHAGYLSVRAGLERMLPGRLVGVSLDSEGKPAYRLALQTREQHIRRDKATSNICTAQALLANVAAMYAAYHGPDGLRAIATRIHRHACAIAAGLRAAGHDVVHERFFDTVLVRSRGAAQRFVAAAEADGINLRLVDSDHVGIACDERTTDDVVARVLAVFDASVQPAVTTGFPAELVRTSTYLHHPVFHEHRSETAMLRFLRELSDKDLALDRSMIPLGSCTMKLNSAVEMEPISWPGFAGIHPYAPAEQTEGYLALIADLEGWLAEITGYDRVSLQPNAGSQGELAGLLAIKAYHSSRGESHRDVCLIPQSAHGTNAASAVLAGMRVVVVGTAANGNIDIADLRAKLAAHDGSVGAIMLTYPSTHGVYENDITTVCDLVHAAGGQVYVDGANLNALVGLAKPGRFGGDVSHLNLHKTFCIPHGGGGPGVGPVAVRAHLAPFLPGDPLAEDGPAPVSAANYGSAGILPITWAYLALMGPDGLTAATKSAVLAANYLADALTEHYPVLYTGPAGLVAHECILDLRALTKATGVTAEDVAKRLIDYGFHAPTLSFPVNGTLMVEPTESENLAELDRFIEAMIAIRHEIDQVGSGVWPLEQSPLRQAPHTAEQVTAPDWDLPYDRQYAVYPVDAVRRNKYWPPVRRIDGVHGDRNLVCSCPAPEAFEITDAPAVSDREEVFA